MDELALMLAGVAERSSAPLIVDNGALLDEDGRYLSETLLLFNAVARDADVTLCMVHSRRPNIEELDLKALHALHFRVPPLDLTSTTLLARQSLRQAAIEATPNQAKALAVYMDGYPPAVSLAVRLIRDYGLTTVLSDTSRLVDFKIRTFAGVLERLALGGADWQCLRLLATQSPMPLEGLSALLGSDDADTAKLIGRLTDLSLVTPRVDLFEIAAPIREAVFNARGRLNDTELEQVTVRLKEAFWDKNVFPRMEIVAATVYAAARSGSPYLSEFSGVMLPSILYRSAQERYNTFRRDGWEAARDLAEKALELHPKHKRARVLLFKAFVRLNEWSRADSVLKEIMDGRYVERHYLRGFSLWKRNQLEEAISAFEVALTADHRSPSTYHGLASCQFRTGRRDAALNTIKNGLEKRKPNKYLLDLGVQVAVELGKYNVAEDYLDELSRLNEDEDYHHRAATLLAATGDFEEALHHADQAVLGHRVRFEALATRINILIEMGRFERADEELNALDTRFQFGPERHDVRCHLRCKRLLREERWREAEHILNEVNDKKDSYYVANRIAVLTLKVADPSVSPGERIDARNELTRLEREALPPRLLVHETPEFDAEE